MRLVLFCAAVSLRSASSLVVPCLTATLQAERCVGVDGALDRVPFACIPEAQFRATRFPRTLDQLTIEKILVNAACVHSPHIDEPPEASLVRSAFRLHMLARSNTSVSGPSPAT